MKGLHLDPIERTDLHSGDHAVGRWCRLELYKALAETINGLYKTEVIRHQGLWCRPSRTRHRRVGGLVQHHPTIRVLRRHPAGRAGARPVPSGPAANGGCTVKQPRSPELPGRFKMAATMLLERIGGLKGPARDVVLPVFISDEESGISLLEGGAAS